MSKRHAFTLIELLIVVAIIAILAAIAVPNFLEAQVRSKVSRQLSNMRTVATALEAYAVDTNHYPPTTIEPYDIAAAPGDPAASTLYKIYPHYTLTSPVAYISSDAAMIDIFRAGHNYQGRLANQIMWLPSFLYDPDGPYNHLKGASTYAAQRNRYGLWVMRSAGPDAYYQNVLGDKADYGTGPGGWNRAGYDPTNGSVSGGDIYRSQNRPDDTHALK